MAYRLAASKITRWCDLFPDLAFSSFQAYSSKDMMWHISDLNTWTEILPNTLLSRREEKKKTLKTPPWPCSRDLATCGQQKCMTVSPVTIRVSCSSEEACDRLSDLKMFSDAYNWSHRHIFLKATVLKVNAFLTLYAQKHWCYFREWVTPWLDHYWGLFLKYK